MKPVTLRGEGNHHFRKRESSNVTCGFRESNRRKRRGLKGETVNKTERTRGEGHSLRRKERQKSLLKLGKKKQTKEEGKKGERRKVRRPRERGKKGRRPENTSLTVTNTQTVSSGRRRGEEKRKKGGAAGSKGGAGRKT